ncbi:MAG: SMC family ATPase, partial [Rubrivirga sp.]
SLRAERSALDDKAALFRGIESQRHQVSLDLERKKAEAQREVDSLSAALDRLGRQIEADTTLLADGETARAALKQAEKAKADLARLDAQRAERDQKNARIDTIDKRLAAQKGVLEGQRGQVIEEGKRLKAETETASAPDLDALQAAVASAMAAHARREAIHGEGTEAGATVKNLEAEIRRIEADKTRIEARLAKLDQSDDDVCPTCGTALTEAHRLEVAEDLRSDLRALEDARRSADGKRAQAVKRRDDLRSEFTSLASVLEAGQEAEKALSQRAEQAKRAAERAQRLEDLRATALRLGKRLADEDYEPELRAERTMLMDALEAGAYDQVAHEAVRRDASLHEHWSRQVRALDVATERLAESKIDRDRRSKALGDRRDQIDRGVPFQDVTARLAMLATQIESLGYDAASHEAISAKLEHLKDAPQRLTELLEARRRRAELAEQSKRLADDRAALEGETVTQRKRLSSLEASLAARAEAVEVHKQASARRAAASQKLSTAQGQLGALDERLARAGRDRDRLKEARKELRAVKKERALFGHLRRAFGKNGIPSLIIEETLPEIEERANGLLDRLSRGRTRVALETLKDKKTGGGTKETLDIRITDDQGVARSYETFSGGEAFRVNFALRIALSQMLAERSGTQIRTLVIDEGFGTQDAEGLQRLIGAIRAIQDDFRTIIVITHLDELKDAFPVRIEVRKEPVTGSTFDVIGA